MEHNLLPVSCYVTAWMLTMATENRLLVLIKDQVPDEITKCLVCDHFLSETHCTAVALWMCSMPKLRHDTFL